jgi:transcriptional regulator with XRE-family HTH domain
LGVAIKALRLRRSMTQVDLARKAAVSRQWLIGIEAGSRARAEISSVMAVLNALDASLWIRDDARDDAVGP